MSEPDSDMLAHYSRALDEIYALRCALAWEAREVQHVLNGYASLPKTARRQLGAAAERLRESARGNASVAYEDVSVSWPGVLRHIGVPETLTRSQWEASR